MHVGPRHDKGGEAGQGMVHQAASPGVGGRGRAGAPLVAMVGTGVAAVTNREKCLRLHHGGGA